MRITLVLLTLLCVGCITPQGGSGIPPSYWLGRIQADQQAQQNIYSNWQQHMQTQALQQINQTMQQQLIQRGYRR